MTAKYQPVTREYKKYWIIMKPSLWGKMYQLRYYLGYYMSCILRIMLDWEIQNMGRDIIPLVVKPESSLRQQRIQNRIRSICNYTLISVVNYEEQRVFPDFLMDMIDSYII